jgi:hypothetical protein
MTGKRKSGSFAGSSKPPPGVMESRFIGAQRAGGEPLYGTATLQVARRQLPETTQRICMLGEAFKIFISKEFHGPTG